MVKDNTRKKKQNNQLKFIDLFAGIGGFHLAFHSIGAECVFASEWDKFARHTYEHNFKKISPNLFENGNFNVDINDQKPEEIPDFDILCAGFPCQPFSNAGLKKGFEDTRGTLFFKLAEIVHHKIKKGSAPKVLLLENVKGLKSHDKGHTLKTIIRILEELGYIVGFEVLSNITNTSKKITGTAANLTVGNITSNAITINTSYGITSSGDATLNSLTVNSRKYRNGESSVLTSGTIDLSASSHAIYKFDQTTNSVATINLTNGLVGEVIYM